MLLYLVLQDGSLLAADCATQCTLHLPPANPVARQIAADLHGGLRRLARQLQLAKHGIAVRDRRRMALLHAQGKQAYVL